MARRPKPTALKELEGNPGHRPLNDEEPKPEAGLPEMPRGMSKAARREWANIAPALLRLGALSRIDGKALAAYCDAYAMWELARKDIDKHGLVIEQPKLNGEGLPIYLTIGTCTCGNGLDASFHGAGCGAKRGVMHELKANPAVSVYNTMAKLMKSFLIEFGLTPASRSKLKIEKPKADDPMENFLKGPQGVQQVKQAAVKQFDTGIKTPAAKPVVPEITATDFDA